MEAAASARALRATFVMLRIIARYAKSSSRRTASGKKSVPVSEPAWRADLWGRRILFWTAHAPLILSSGDLVYRSRVLNTLARGARHIDRGAEKMAPGLPRIAAQCGVVAAGLPIGKSLVEPDMIAEVGRVLDEAGQRGVEIVLPPVVVCCCTSL